VVCTHHKQLRLYDRRQQSRRRPTVDLDVAKKFVKLNVHPFNALTLRDTAVFAGDTAGNVFRFDTRKLDRVYGRYKGPVGSIRSLAVVPNMPLLAVSSIDRYLRIYDIGSRKLVFKFYLKQQLGAVVTQYDSSIDVPLPDDEREDDELWQSMQAARNSSDSSDDSDDDVDQFADNPSSSRKRPSASSSSSSSSSSTIHKKKRR
jgi:ribosome biogenesis protein NSA1